jgi:hypothetical protein
MLFLSYPIARAMVGMSPRETVTIQRLQKEAARGITIRKVVCFVVVFPETSDNDVELHSCRKLGGVLEVNGPIPANGVGVGYDVMPNYGVKQVVGFPNPSQSGC